jgi:hypothetical protein
MVERIEGLPAGVMGFRLWGTITREEYDTQLLPPLQAAVDGGGPIRYFVQVGPEFEGLKAGAVWDDAKEGLQLIGSHSRWEKVAVVTDVDLIVRTIGIFGFMVPGDVKTYKLTERDDALAWIAV